uniref:Uncharacterized protein n=1 Tax=Oncorhynchus kisutch TaxID=8019 RepID=A0A8C7MM11_ONCKI
IFNVQDKIEPGCDKNSHSGGGSSDLFGGYKEEAAASRQPHKMASNHFAPPEAQGVIRQTNPPGPEP